MIPLVGTIFEASFNTAAPLLADGGDLFGLFVVIIFLLISFLSRLPQMLNEQQKKQANPRPPAQRPAGGGGLQRPIPQQQPLNPQAGLQQPAQRRPLGDLANQQPAAAAVVVPAAVVPANVPAALPADRSVRPLGNSLPSALDQKLDQHVHAVFDHEVGSLGEDEAQHVATLRAHAVGSLPDQQQAYEADELKAYAGSEDQPTADSPIAQELLALLRTRTGVRNAILLGEILRRPEDRWAL